MTDLTERQAARNRETQNQPSFASHREHVMRLISDAAATVAACNTASPQGAELPAITVIGAGNCQDIDLPALSASFREIRLIDIDADAVGTAVSQLAADVGSRIRIFAPFDIAAPLMSLSVFDSHAAAIYSPLLAALESSSLNQEIPVSNLVVSTCLLSQLLDSAAQIAPPDSPMYLPLVQAIRRGHLARLLSLTAAAGSALLITDLVSSDTVSNLAQTLPADLPKLMFECLQSGNFFSGLNPAVVQHDIQHIPGCLQLCSSSRILPPWHWHLGPRTFAVYAVELVRI